MERRNWALTVNWSNFCLDSAHDNLPTYRLLEHWEINTLIDSIRDWEPWTVFPRPSLWTKMGSPSARQTSRCATGAMAKTKDGISATPWPAAESKNSPCASECSKSTYERTAHVQNDLNCGFIPGSSRTVSSISLYIKERTAYSFRDYTSTQISSKFIIIIKNKNDNKSSLHLYKEVLSPLLLVYHNHLTISTIIFHHQL